MSLTTEPTRMNNTYSSRRISTCSAMSITRMLLQVLPSGKGSDGYGSGRGTTGSERSPQWRLHSAPAYDYKDTSIKISFPAQTAATVPVPGDSSNLKPSEHADRNHSSAIHSTTVAAWMFLFLHAVRMAAVADICLEGPR